jgi:hypothetical protein
MKAIDNMELRRDRSCASGVQKMHQMAWRRAGERGDQWIGTTGITEVTKMWIKRCKERRRQEKQTMSSAARRRESKDGSHRQDSLRYRPTRQPSRTAFGTSFRNVDLSR